MFRPVIIAESQPALKVSFNRPAADVINVFCQELTKAHRRGAASMSSTLCLFVHGEKKKKVVAISGIRA